MLDSFAHNGKLLEPAGRAHDAVHAEHRETPDIYRRGYGCAEFHGGIDAAQRLVRQALPTGIVAAGKFRAHFESVLRVKPLEELADFSLADNGEALAHDCAAPVARSCRTMRA